MSDSGFLAGGCYVELRPCCTVVLMLASLRLHLIIVLRPSLREKHSSSVKPLKKTSSLVCLLSVVTPITVCIEACTPDPWNLRAGKS